MSDDEERRESGDNGGAGPNPTVGEAHSDDSRPDLGDATRIDPGPTERGVVPDPTGEVDAGPAEARVHGAGAVVQAGALPADRVAQPGFELDDFSVADTSPRRSPRRASSLIPWILLLLILAVAAFFALRVHIPMRQEHESTLAELDDARRDNGTLKAQVETLKGELAQLEAEVEQRQQEVEALQSTQLELVEKLQAEIDKGNVLIKQKHGELVVDLVDKILFDSGEAELNEKGKEVLLHVGETFLKLEDKLIRVAGHTDAVPISDKLLETFPTNWELSTARATNVVRFLQDEAKIPGKRLAVVGRSEYAPIASNATRSGRRRNRRIEVTLMPLKGKR